MKLQSKTLVALAVSGLVAGYTMMPQAFAGDDTAEHHAEKEGCKGMEAEHKDSCKGMKDADKAEHDDADTAEHEEGDKDSCKGKEGCKSK